MPRPIICDCMSAIDEDGDVDIEEVAEDQPEKGHQQIGDGRSEIAIQLFAARWSECFSLRDRWLRLLDLSTAGRSLRGSSPTGRSSVRSQPDSTTARARSPRIERPLQALHFEEQPPSRGSRETTRGSRPAPARAAAARPSCVRSRRFGLNLDGDAFPIRAARLVRLATRIRRRPSCPC